MAGLPDIERVGTSPGQTPAVIVFGGSRGIGRATVLVFAENGYRVGIIYHRNEKAALETVNLARRRGAPEAYHAQADAVNWDSVKAAVDTLASKLGGSFNVLVYSSGILEAETVESLDVETWKRVIDVNLSGAFYAVKASLPYLEKAGWASIVFIASIAGQTGNIVAGPAYAASKAGLIGLTKRLAVMLAGKGIRVNAVAPSFVETDMTRNYLDTEEKRRRILELHPLRIILQPEDVAKAVYFLADPEWSRGITGHILSINAGRYT